MNWLYFEYADDLVARKPADNGERAGMPFQVWIKDHWEDRYDFARFEMTSQRIQNVPMFVSSRPDLAAAFQAR